MASTPEALTTLDAVDVSPFLVFEGAGLAVVRRIADAHGWSVSADNDDGARVDVVV